MCFEQLIESANAMAALRPPGPRVPYNPTGSIRLIVTTFLTEAWRYPSRRAWGTADH